MHNQNMLIKNVAVVLLMVLVFSCNTKTKSDEIALFNGKNLVGWKGNTKVWSVENGCIVGKTIDANKIEQNTFLIYKDEFSNFELTFQYKIIGGNSGVQYRSKVIDENIEGNKTQTINLNTFGVEGSNSAILELCNSLIR